MLLTGVWIMWWDVPSKQAEEELNRGTFGPPSKCTFYGQGMVMCDPPPFHRIRCSPTGVVCSKPLPGGGHLGCVIIETLGIRGTSRVE